MSISRDDYLLAMSIPRGVEASSNVSEYISKYGNRTTFMHFDDLEDKAVITVEDTPILEATKYLCSINVPLQLKDPGALRFTGSLELNRSGMIPSSILSPTPSLVPSTQSMGILSALTKAL